MENLIIKRQPENVVYTLNELYNNGNIYVMDNHMAASWCWSQKIDFNKQYNFFHIDRHYDLLNGNVKFWVNKLREQNFDFENSTIEEYSKAGYEDTHTKQKVKIFRYDNYITIFNKYFPNLLKEKKFATHKDGTVPVDWDMYEIPFYHLHTNLAYWINETNEKWILNIDLDYFFCDDDEGNRYQVLTDDYIKSIGAEISRCIDNIEVITIALSPTFCGGLENSKRVAILLLNSLKNSNFEL